MRFAYHSNSVRFTHTQLSSYLRLALGLVTTKTNMVETAAVSAALFVVILERRKRCPADPKGLREGPEGVNWELGFAPFQGWELGFNALGLGFFHWEWDKFFGIGNEYSLFCPVSIQLNGPIMLEIYYVKNRINLCH